MKHTPVNAENLSGMLTKARKAGTVRIEGSTYDERRAQFMKDVLGMDDNRMVEGTTRGQKKKDFAR
jgi:flagellar motor component MotA